MATARVEVRLSARVPANVRELIALAAQAVGATMNQFLVQSAVEKATEILERERVISLSSRDAQTVLDLMENPPEPNEALRACLKSPA